MKRDNALIITFFIGVVALWPTPAVVSASPLHDASQPKVLNASRNQAPFKASLDQMEWLVGQWQGTLDKARQQHMVFKPVSGHMPGFVRAWGADGTIWFYELFDLVEVGGTLEIRVKHFTPDLAGWEGKDEYIGRRLVLIAGNTFFFDGITLVNKSENEHTVYYRIPDGEREGEILVVHQKRIPPGG